MQLIFCKNQAVAQSLLQSADPDAELFSHDDLRLFTHDGIQRPFSESSGSASHLLTQIPEGVASTAFIHHSLNLFDSSWSRAFVEHVAGSVVDSGFIHLPAPRSGKAPMLAEDDLFDILGSPVSSRTFDGREYFCFHARVCTRTASSLCWSIDHQQQLKCGEMDRAQLIRDRIHDSDDDLFNRLLSKGSRIEPPDSTLHAPVDSARAQELFSYFHAAVAPKMAMMRELANSIDVNGDVHHVDVGGGMGNLGAELILDKKCAVGTSLNVEFDSARMIMGESLLDMYESELSGRWLFDPVFAQDHAFEGHADLITALGSLLYIPRADLVACLDRAWASLNPGGMMVVYEHIKHPRFVHDHDCMFEKDELEALLHRFGDFHCVSGSSLVPMNNEVVGEKSVYRVLRKQV